MPLFSSTIPTPTRPALAIEVTVVYLGEREQEKSTEEPQPAGTALPTTILSLVDTVTPTPGPTVIPIDTPIFQPTASPSPTVTPLPPTATLTPTSIITGTDTVTDTLAETASSGEDSVAEPQPDPSLPVQGSISLLAPENYAALPSNANELEFKWLWQGSDTKLKRCEKLEGYGFEVRIMPARDGFGFLGAMDAAKNQEDSFFGCDPESGVRTYLVKYLKDKPGVKAGGAGKFLWDVALVQLDPYQPIITPVPRIFEISFDYQGSLDPFGAPLSCSDFASWVEAQALFLKAGGPAQDRHGLDPDANGIACEDLQ